MTDTLPLCDTAESTARQFLETGRPERALAIVRRLLARPESLGTSSARLHRLAALALVALGRFTSARNQLARAFRDDTTDAETAFRLGGRFETDEDGCPERAAKWFRRAATLSPRSARYLAAYGRAAIRIGRRTAGVNAVTKAVDLAPGDADVLTVAVAACRLVRRADLAKRWIDRARFLSPRSDAVRQLWDRVRYDLACKSQRATVIEPSRTVPFLRLVGDDRVPVRRDAGKKAQIVSRRVAVLVRPGE